MYTPYYFMNVLFQELNSIFFVRNYYYSFYHISYSMGHVVTLYAISCHNGTCHQTSSIGFSAPVTNVWQLFSHRLCKSTMILLSDTINIPPQFSEICGNLFNWFYFGLSLFYYFLYPSVARHSLGFSLEALHARVFTEPEGGSHFGHRVCHFGPTQGDRWESLFFMNFCKR